VATLVDLDHDGDLDLAACTADELGIWINRGAMVFDLVPSAGAAAKGNAITTLAAVDWDRDIDSDILAVADNGRQLFILENQRHLEFSWHAVEAGPAARGGEPPLLNAGVGVESLAVIESDGNASWDVAVVGASGARLVLTDTPAPGSTQLRKVANYDDIKSGASGGRLVLADLDNDGHDDFLIVADGRLAVHRGASGGMASEPWKLSEGPVSGVADVDAVDFDLDGDLDVVVCGAEGVRVLRNEGGTKNHWLDIWITGLDEALSGRVNHFAVGAFVEVKSGTSYQAKLVTRPFTHFGLGARTDVDVARVMFPNGVPQSVVKPRRDELLLEAQRLLGSCPYLYTWTGERFEFFTDLLWAAPIGLQVADGVIMRDRPWEYLKIDGERLAQRDGEYQIQITEELWEAGYFDQVELIAVDHPADVEVFSNEKVGPPTIAQRMIHTARRKQAPVSVRNHRGRDLSAETARRDGVFAQPFDRTIMQGVAERHHIEIDLGAAALATSATGSASAKGSA
ncbi:MAG TPA: CRTAC1 family protein, partial [Pirellulaceae bacterium]|nr:CRTAC1 family protein [Pirellulaceae bacterium]